MKKLKYNKVWDLNFLEYMNLGYEVLNAIQNKSYDLNNLIEVSSTLPKHLTRQHWLRPLQ